MTDADVAEFDRAGAVCQRGVFDEAWIDLLHDGIDACLVTPRPPRPGEEPSRAGDGFYVHRHRWRDVEPFRRFVFESPAVDLAARFLRAEKVNFLEDHCFHAHAGIVGVSPWHHDLPYYDVAGSMLSIWMPLQPLAASDGLRLVAGSHRWGKLFLPTGVTREGYDYEPVPAIDESREEILSWDMEPGDCVVFSARTLHCVTPPAPGSISRRFSTRWTGDAVFHERGGVCSRGFNEMGLHEGGPLDSEWYPVVWRAGYGRSSSSRLPVDEGDSRRASTSS